MSPSANKKENVTIAERIRQTGPLRLAILAGCGYIAVQNMEPYCLTIAPIVASPDAAVLGMFYKIPLIGSRLQDLGWLFGLGAGVLPWAIIQTLETLPTLMEADRKNIKNAIDGIVQNAKSLNLSPDADPRLAELVQRYNNLPVDTLKKFYTLRMIAYAIDAVVVLWYYPPFLAGWDFLGYGVWPLPSDFDWGNLLTVGAILFLFQVLVGMYLWMGNVRRYLVIKEVKAA